MEKKMTVQDFRALINQLSSANEEYLIQTDSSFSSEKENNVHETNAELKIQNIDVLLICAVDDEYDAIKEYLDYNKIALEYSEDVDGFYFLLNSGKKKISCILVKQKEAGMVSCACLCGRLLKYKPKLVVMPGICGGINGKVRQGDIVAASTVYDYGSGKYQVDGTFEPSPYQCQIDPRLTRYINAASQYFKTILNTCAPHVLCIKDKNGNSFIKNESNMQIKQGTVATGASVVNNEAIVGAMRSHNRNVIAYDMEAYALAYVCTYFSDVPIPWLVIKGVQDFPNTEDKSMYTKLAAHVSSAIAVDVVKRFFI